MTEEFEASLQAIAEELRQEMTDVRRMQQDIKDITATARTRDGFVRIEVGPHGELHDLHLDPRVYDRMRPQQLAHTIMKLVGEATQDASSRRRDLTAAFLPEELAERLRNGGQDFSDFFPGVAVQDDEG